MISRLRALAVGVDGVAESVVGFAAGGPTDIIARLIGQWLSERLGQQFVIENRPGAAGKIATEASVVRAPPDGYTLLQVGMSAAINDLISGQVQVTFLLKFNAPAI